MLELDLIPVLVGADLNCYNVARAFHEEYGVKSHAFGKYSIGATKYTKIVEFHTVEHLDNADILVSVLTDFANAHPDSTMILLGCTDDYATMLMKNKARLEDKYIIPYINESLMKMLVSKANFYRICDEYGVPYPKTAILSSDYTEDMLDEKSLGFPYPLIVKPSSSIEYWKHPFDGMKKVYVADNKDEALEIVKTIYASGYSDEMIIQDFIPGDDSNMNVLTAYSNKDGQVKMMCLGHVLLEEHTPKGLGNHAAIITEYKPEVTAPFKAMLEDLGYRGFSNFDIKYDPRDGSMRVFEINLRQGRSNYYITAAGINIAKLIVEDYIQNKELPYIECKNEHYWHSIPTKVVYKYVKSDELKNKVKTLIKNKKESSSLWYKYDLRLNPKRLAYVLIHLYRHFEKYKKYCK